jgi:uncharacterized protein (TIGR02147 family)
MQGTKVTDYLNFREYLRDSFEWQKANDPGFSQKRIQIEIGAASSGFLSNVLAGRKNLMPNQSARLSRLLNLDRVESAYFENLVLFTQARTVEEKNEFFNRLMTMQSARLKQLEEHSLTLFSKWYYVAIREVLGIIDWRGDDNALAKALQPEIKPSEAHEAIEVLTQLGLVRREETGRAVPCDPAISTGDELFSRHLAHFQMTTLDLAKQALMGVPPEERDISVLTMGLSPDTFRLVKHELQYFRKRLAKIAVDETCSNRVYQVNLQLFPITKELLTRGGHK